MKQLKSYTAYVSSKGELAIITPFLSASDPFIPTAYYDGGKHVLFRKNTKEEYILDYLDERACEILKITDEILIVESDVEKDIVYQQYPVRVEHMLNKLTLQLEVSSEN